LKFHRQSTKSSKFYASFPGWLCPTLAKRAAALFCRISAGPRFTGLNKLARRLKRPGRFGIGEDVWCVRNDVMGYHWYLDMQLSWAIRLFLEYTWAIPAIPWIPFWLIGWTCELGIQASSKDLPRGRNRGDDPRICRSLVNNIINIWLYNLLITYLQILIWSQLQKLKEFDSVWSAWHATRMFHMFQQRNHRIRIPIQFNTF